MRDRADIAAELDRTFDESVGRALSVPGTREPAWALSIPTSLRDSIVSAALLDGGVVPATLLAHYAVKMPEELVDQFFRRGDRRELLWEAVSGADLPRYAEALDGLEASLASAGILPADVMIRERAGFAGNRSLADVYAGTVFASGLPFLGGHSAERTLLGAALDRGASWPELLDRWMSGNLLHELCHGPVVDWTGTPPPWHLSEAASLHLGAAARSRHVFPDEVGEAIPGVARFVLLGDGLSRMFGPRALWSLSAGVTTVDAFGARAAAVFEVAEWQDWLKRRVPPFAFDANDALDWLKLADATRAGMPVKWLQDAASIDPLDRTALDARPSLVDTARTLAWRDLPWWHEATTAHDEAILRRAFDAMFLVNRMAPTFQTHPDEVPGGVLVLDVERCELSARRRPHGVWAEPATWIVPPPVGRRLFERGARVVRFEDARRENRLEMARFVLELAAGTSPLPSEVVHR